ncbi:MAG: non-ribosomal peptide synthetase, partial [bacterium]|nr:non-ribosomal peptide synthetase [bacterium]
GLVKKVKESLRQVPHGGIGHGILKYITGQKNKQDVEFKLHPRLRFNYLGQFDGETRQQSFFMAAESPGVPVDPESQRPYDLELSGLVTNQRLVMSIAYGKHQYKRQTIQTLMEQFHRQLCRVIDFCLAQKTSQPTPADFTYPGLSIQQVDHLNAAYRLQDIYTLSPMQEGMLFHALYEPASLAYFEQISYRFQGTLNPDVVSTGLKELFKRHDILRTVFIHEGLARPVQLVLKERPVDFLYKDLRRIGTGNLAEKEDFIKTFKDEDKQQPFDLSGDVLMRVAIFRVHEQEYEFIWSFHHILMDGWCLGV